MCWARHLIQGLLYKDYKDYNIPMNLKLGSEQNARKGTSGIESEKSFKEKASKPKDDLQVNTWGQYTKPSLPYCPVISRKWAVVMQTTTNFIYSCLGYQMSSITETWKAWINNGRSKFYLIPNKRNPSNDWKWNIVCRPGADLEEAIKFGFQIWVSNGATLWNHRKKFWENLNEIEEKRNLREIGSCRSTEQVVEVQVEETFSYDRVGYLPIGFLFWVPCGVKKERK